MATRVWESAVIPASVEKTWGLIRPLDFSYHPNVVSAEIDGKASHDEVGVTKLISYKDGTKQRVKLIGLSDATYSLSWDLIESDPPVAYSSCSHTIRLRRVTDSNQTFITWTTDYSKDASLEVTEDQRHKQRENFSAIQAAVKGGAKEDKKEIARVLPGGVGPANPIDEETGKFIASVRNQVEAKAGQSFDEFKPISFRKQVVAGLNYIVKIQVGGQSYIHVKIWRRPSGEVQVTDVKPAKKDDAL
jgi:hypothetical protein